MTATNAGRVAGLEPVSFITTASPHLGIRALVPKALENALRVASYGGRSAKQVPGGSLTHHPCNAHAISVYLPMLPFALGCCHRMTAHPSGLRNRI